MPITTSTSVPGRFRAGDTVKWTESLTEYPATNWELTYIFTKEGCDPVESTATASGSDHAATLTAADSGEFSAGRWNWFARVSDQDEGTLTVKDGTVTVLPDPTASGEQSFAQKALQMVEKSLTDDLPTAQESFNVAGVDITTMSLSERYQLRDKLKAEVARERNHNRVLRGGRRRGGFEIRLG